MDPFADANIHQTFLKVQTGLYVQHHQASQRAESVVGNVADVVQGERHGLQSGQLAQGLRRNLGQGVIVQPEVPQRAQAGEGAGRDAGDVVGIQTPLNRGGWSLSLA